MAGLEPFAQDLWTLSAPQKFHGVELGTRMTVIRLGDGRLWVHSPVAIDASQTIALRELGPVAYVIAPNRLHYLYLADFIDRFPDAGLYLAPKLAKKLPAFDPAPAYVEELTSQAPPGWAAEIGQCLIEGIPRFQELVFLHRPSRSLIVTDAIYDLSGAPSRWTRLLARLVGRNRPGGLFDEPRLRLVKDDVRVAASLRKIAAWDFDHIVLAHGSCVRDIGKQAFQRAYGRLLAAEPA